MREKFLQIVEKANSFEEVSKLAEARYKPSEAFLELKELLYPPDENGSVSDSIAQAKLKAIVEKEVGDKSKDENLATCKGQVENLQAKLSSEGRGVNYPPCVVDAQGQPSYIFDVAVTDNGVLAKQNLLEKQNLPLLERLAQRVRFDSELSHLEFGNNTRHYLDYGVRNNCRFFVRLYDNTGPSNKRQYKVHRRAIEGNFYILDKKDQRLS